VRERVREKRARARERARERASEPERESETLCSPDSSTILLALSAMFRRSTNLLPRMVPSAVTRTLAFESMIRLARACQARNSEKSGP